MAENKKRKRKPLRHPEKITYVLDEPVKEKKDHKVLKRVLLGIFLAVGTAIIVSAIVLLLNVLKADNVDSTGMTATLSEFEAAYDEFPSERELPAGLEVTSAEFICRDGSYTINVTIKNVDSDAFQMAIQLYCSDALCKLRNSYSPAISYSMDDEFYIPAGESKTLTLTGVLSNELSEDEIKAAGEYVYIEAFTSNKSGRIMLPLEYKTA